MVSSDESRSNLDDESVTLEQVEVVVELLLRLPQQSGNLPDRMWLREMQQHPPPKGVCDDAQGSFILYVHTIQHMLYRSDLSTNLAPDANAVRRDARDRQ